MPKMILSIDGVVIKDMPLTKERTTIGRRPYNEVVIDNLAVSGEHACVHLSGNDIVLEDLNSTNGTYVNGKPIKKQLLQPGDVVDIGKYKVKFKWDGVASGSTPLATMSGFMPARPSLGGLSEPMGLDELLQTAALRVLTGAAAGREVELVKLVTTIGKPGVTIAAITRRPTGYVITHVEGANPPTINGQLVTTDDMRLSSGDVIELAGTQMEFLLR